MRKPDFKVSARQPVGRASWSQTSTTFGKTVYRRIDLIVRHARTNASFCQRHTRLNRPAAGFTLIWWIASFLAPSNARTTHLNLHFCRLPLTWASSFTPLRRWPSLQANVPKDADLLMAGLLRGFGHESRTQRAGDIAKRQGQADRFRRAAC